MCTAGRAKGIKLVGYYCTTAATTSPESAVRRRGGKESTQRKQKVEEDEEGLCAALLNPLSTNKPNPTRAAAEKDKHIDIQSGNGWMAGDLFF